MLTVDREKNTTAEEPTAIIRISISLSMPENSKLLTGSASTVSPTAEGMAMIMENRMALLIFDRTSFRFFPAMALDRDGIRDEDRELAIATGMLKSI